MKLEDSGTLTLDPETQPVLLIVCSAAISSLKDHEPLLQKYGVGVLPRPFDMDALLDKVQAALRKGKTGLEDGQRMPGSGD